MTALIDLLASESCAAVLPPPPDLSVAEWADEFRMLSSESSAEPGRWRTDRAPYQRGIMDAASDASVREVVVMSSAQVGKTEFLLNIVGYYIHQDPSPIMLLQPTLDMAESFSKDRLAPMVRDTPALQGKIADARARDSGNTLLHKKFPGGQITMAGANSPASLASRPIRVVMCDEVDRYPMSAGTEGDPVSLAKKRTATFWNRKVVLVSTPTVAGISRIEAAYERSDKRRFFVPCPHCGHMHLLSWKNVVFDEADPDRAQMVCPECGGMITDQHKPQMLLRGQWIGETDCKGIAGFHINELYSPWRRFGDVVADFLAAKHYPEKLKTWVNTALGEVWEDRDGDAINETTLAARRQAWNRDALPDGVVCLTAGVDTQDDRLEATIVAWLSEKRVRVVSHHVIPGNPGEPMVWEQLDTLLLDPVKDKEGSTFSVIAACVDAGGHHAASVLEFCEQRRGRKVWAVRGKAGPNPIWPKRYSKSAKHKGKQQWLIGVDTSKDWLKSALAVQDENMPHHIGFSSDPSLDDPYFRQLLVERRTVSYDRQGRPVRTWKAKPGARVEAWDCLNYAHAALEGLREMWRLQLVPKKKPEAEKPAPEKPNPLTPPTRRRVGGFAKNW